MTASHLNQIAAFSRSLNARIEEVLKTSFKRSLSELTALVSIQNCDQFHVGWLAETLELQHSSAVRVVDRLEQDGLISRLAKDSKKQVGLKITANGATLANAVLALRAQVTESFLSSLHADEISILAKIIQPVIVAQTRSSIGVYRHCALCDENACVDCPSGSGIDDKKSQSS
jgi:DNA-binding MarR family transcriptional regulator